MSVLKFEIKHLALAGYCRRREMERLKGERRREPTPTSAENTAETLSHCP